MAKLIFVSLENVTFEKKCELRPLQSLLLCSLLMFQCTDELRTVFNLTPRGEVAPQG
jgi:hypothetical protein